MTFWSFWRWYKMSAVIFAQETTPTQVAGALTSFSNTQELKGFSSFRQWAIPMLLFWRHFQCALNSAEQCALMSAMLFSTPGIHISLFSGLGLIC
jgi:hypothetical protein